MRNVIASIVIVAIVAAGAWSASDQPPAAAGPKETVASWPNFLGAQRNGTAPDKGLNWEWKKTPPKVLWKVELGSGFSSFAIAGERANCSHNARRVAGSVRFAVLACSCRNS